MSILIIFYEQPYPQFKKKKKKKEKDEGASYPEALTEDMRGNGKEIKAQLYLAKS